MPPAITCLVRTLSRTRRYPFGHTTPILQWTGLQILPSTFSSTSERPMVASPPKVATPVAKPAVYLRRRNLLKNPRKNQALRMPVVCFTLRQILPALGPLKILLASEGATTQPLTSTLTAPSTWSALKETPMYILHQAGRDHGKVARLATAAIQGRVFGRTPSFGETREACSK